MKPISMLMLHIFFLFAEILMIAVTVIGSMEFEYFVPLIFVFFLIMDSYLRWQSIKNLRAKVKMEKDLKSANRQIRDQRTAWERRTKRLMKKKLDEMEQEKKEQERKKHLEQMSIDQIESLSNLLQSKIEEEKQDTQVQ